MQINIAHCFSHYIDDLKYPIYRLRVNILFLNYYSNLTINLSKLWHEMNTAVQPTVHGLIFFFLLQVHFSLKVVQTVLTALADHISNIYRGP